MLNEKMIREFCEKNGYRYNYFGLDAIIDTPLEQWKLEGTEKYNHKRNTYETIIRLKHRNQLGNSTGKAHFHTQRVVGKLEWALETIEEHGLDGSYQFNSKSS